MKVRCPSCETQYKIKDEIIPEEGASIRCQKCGTDIFVSPGGGDQTDTPGPSPAATAFAPAPAADDPFDFGPAPAKGGGDQFSDSLLDLDDITGSDGAGASMKGGVIDELLGRAPGKVAGGPAARGERSEFEPDASLIFSDEFPGEERAPRQTGAVPPPLTARQREAAPVDLDINIDTETGTGGALGTGFDDDFLEELSSITGAETDSERFFRIRRASGKQFGPFPATVIEGMLRKGKLNGSEELSQNEGAWNPIRSHERFRKLVDEMLARREELSQAQPSGAVASLDQLADEGEKDRIETAKKSRLERFYDIRTPQKHSRATPAQLKIAIGATAGLALLVVIVMFVLGVGPFSSGDDSVNMFKELSSSLKGTFQDARKAQLASSYTALDQVRGGIRKRVEGQGFPGRELYFSLLAQLDYHLVLTGGQGEDMLLEADSNLEKIKGVQGLGPEEHFPKAYKSLVAGDLEEARAALTKALSLRADDPLALHLLAHSYLGTTTPLKGVQYLQKLEKLGKAGAWAGELMGRLLAQAGNRSEAVKALGKVKNDSPDYWPAQVALEGVMLDLAEDKIGRKESIVGLQNSGKEYLSPLDQAEIGLILYRIAVLQNEHYKAAKYLKEAAALAPLNADVYRVAGNYHLDRRNFKESRTAFERCLALRKSSVPCAIGVARNLVASDLPDRGVLRFQELESKAAEYPDVFFYMGEAYEMLGRDDMALQYFDKAIAASPKDVRYYVRVAEWYLHRKNFVKVGEFVQKARQADPESALVRNILGRMYLGQQQHDLAERELRAAVQIDPRFVEAHTSLADLYIHAGRYEDAVASYENVLRLNDKNDSAYFGIGRTFFEQQKYDKSLENLRKALELKDDLYLYHYYAGLCNYHLKSWKESIDGLRRAAELNGTDAEVAYWLARAFMDSGQVKEAGVEIQRALELQPEEPRYHYMQGLIYVRQDKIPNGIKSFETAIQFKGDYAEAHYEIGRIKSSQGRWRDGLKSLSEAVKVKPDYGIAHLEMGTAYQSIEKYREAEESFGQARRLLPDSWEPPYRLARLEQERGKNQQALTLFREALARDAAQPQIHLHLGFLFKKMRQRGDAVSSFREYLKLSPDADDRKEIEDEIYFLTKQ